MLQYISRIAAPLKNAGAVKITISTILSPVSKPSGDAYHESRIIAILLKTAGRRIS